MLSELLETYYSIIGRWGNRTNLSLTEGEMKQIYHEMINLNVMGELDLVEDKECHVEPPSISI